MAHAAVSFSKTSEMILNEIAALFTRAATPLAPLLFLPAWRMDEVASNK